MGALLPALRAFSCLDLGAGSVEGKENDHIAVPEDYFHSLARVHGLGCAACRGGGGAVVGGCVQVCVCDT